MKAQSAKLNDIDYSLHIFGGIYIEKRKMTHDLTELKILRPLWRKLFRFNGVFGLVLILLFGIPRFMIVLNANVTGSYGAIAVIFVFMWLTPFVLLTKTGRKYIGLKKPRSYRWLFYSFVAGTLICLLTYLVAVLLFKHSYSNWFVYISKSYQVSGQVLNDSQRLTYFLVYSLTGITFSPVGEELFYRGVVHGSFARSLGEKNASIIDSLVFALTHLAHFGIVYIAGSWHFLFIPSLLWFVFMFISSRIFLKCKQKTGSILGAIISHAAFNFAMMYFIFYHILK